MQGNGLSRSTEKSRGIFSDRKIPRFAARSGDRPLHSLAAGWVLKRGFDLLVSAIFLCTLFPFIYLVVGAGIKCTSAGPVLFRQKRHGRNGRIFTCLKFRSMLVNPTADVAPSHADDPRITPLGRVLRYTFVDELPQFINVLRGDMSIVGPRPHMLDDTRRFSRNAEGYMRRLSVRPGITGLAQMLGYRGEVRTHEDLAGRIKYDLWYIDHWSFALDLCIFFRTLRSFLAFGGRSKNRKLK